MVIVLHQRDHFRASMQSLAQALGEAIEVDVVEQPPTYIAG